MGNPHTEDFDTIYESLDWQEDFLFSLLQSFLLTFVVIPVIFLGLWAMSPKRRNTLEATDEKDCKVFHSPNTVDLRIFR